jgi:hypothetical protein
VVPLPFQTTSPARLSSEGPQHGREEPRAEDPKPEAFNELIDAKDEEGDDEASTEDPAETTSGSNPVALAKGVRLFPPVPWSIPFSFHFTYKAFSQRFTSITRLPMEEDLESEHTARLRRLEGDP